jgi:hypothetical protein
MYTVRLAAMSRFAIGVTSITYTMDICIVRTRGTSTSA